MKTIPGMPNAAYLSESLIFTIDGRSVAIWRRAGRRNWCGTVGALSIGTRLGDNLTKAQALAQVRFHAGAPSTAEVLEMHR